MFEALIILILIAGLVDLAVIGLAGLLAVYRLMPRRAVHPVATRKTEKKENAARRERSQVGEIQP